MANINLADYIDHTNLKPTAGYEDIYALCQEAKEYNFKAVCIAPIWVPTAQELLVGTSVAVCTVVGFPLGYSTTESKAREAEEAVKRGALEIDMVIPLGLLKQGNYDDVRKEISEVVYHSREVNVNALVKVIIECCYLTDEEKKKACLLAKEAGAEFVKTSTGFGTGGAVVDDVKLMRQVVGEQTGVKAAGGIRTRADALAMLEAGANRIGTSNGIAIVTGGI